MSSAIVAVVLTLGAAYATALPPPSGAAWAQLEAAAALSSGASDSEAAAARAAAWAEGAPARPPLAVPAAEPVRQDEPPLPKNDFAPDLGFTAAFVAVESPALALMQVPYVGEPLGALAFALLLPAALLAGLLGALIGWLLA